MRLAAVLTTLMFFAPGVAHAITPEDFQGTWVVKRDVGWRDVLGSENPRKMWGTKVHWTVTEVTGAEGVCKLVHAAVVPISIVRLQTEIWGGQTIPGLEIPKSQITRVFDSAETSFFNGGDNYCLQAVMLNHNQILGIFTNGYIYLLDRVGH